MKLFLIEYRDSWWRQTRRKWKATSRNFWRHYKWSLQFRPRQWCLFNLTKEPLGMWKSTFAYVKFIATWSLHFIGPLAVSDWYVRGGCISCQSGQFTILVLAVIPLKLPWKAGLDSGKLTVWQIIFHILGLRSWTSHYTLPFHFQPKREWK